MGPVNALTGDCFENRIYENPVLTPPPVSPPALSPSLRSCFPCVISPLSPPPFFPNFYRIYTKKKTFFSRVEYNSSWFDCSNL